MKRLSLLIVLLCVSLTTMAQDVIVKTDGSTIQSKVLEINGTEIKYKKWSNQDGPMYSINKNEVNSINYQNGEVELFTIEPQNNPSSSIKYSMPELKNGRMARKGSRLTLNGCDLSDEDVRLLIGQDNYEAYLIARKQINVGNVFTPIFWGALGTTVALIAFAYIWTEEVYYNPYYYGAYGGGWKEEPNSLLLGIGYGTAAISVVSLPLMCIFKGIGIGGMNRIADEYNRCGGESAFSYQISPSIMKCNMMAMHNTLGLGLTFSVDF